MYQHSLEKRFCVADVWVDPLDNTFTRDGETFSVPPKVVQILQCFAFQPERALSYDDVLQFAWGHTEVKQASLYQQMALLRRHLGDSRDNPSFIKTLPRFGYRLIADVQFEGAELETAEAPGQVAESISVDSAEFDVAPEGSGVASNDSHWLIWGYGSIAACFSLVLVMLAYQLMLNPSTIARDYSAGHADDLRLAGSVSAALEAQRQKLVAVPVFYFPAGSKYRGLENALADIASERLGRGEGARLTLMPMFGEQHWRDLGQAHWRNNMSTRAQADSRIAYVVEPRYIESERGDFIGFDIRELQSDRVIRHYQTPLSADNPALGLERLERQLLEAVSQLEA